MSCRERSVANSKFRRGWGYYEWRRRWGSCSLIKEDLGVNKSGASFIKMLLNGVLFDHYIKYGY